MMITNEFTGDCRTKPPDDVKVFVTGNECIGGDDWWVDGEVGNIHLSAKGWSNTSAWADACRAAWRIHHMMAFVAQEVWTDD